MDRNDFHDNGQSDHHQHFSGHTSHPGLSYSIKIKLKYFVVFFLEIVKEIKLIRKSLNFTGRGPYHA